jgi:hypothetical protein
MLKLKLFVFDVRCWCSCGVFDDQVLKLKLKLLCAGASGVFNGGAAGPPRARTRRPLQTKLLRAGVSGVFNDKVLGDRGFYNVQLSGNMLLPRP